MKDSANEVQDDIWMNDLAPSDWKGSSWKSDLVRQQQAYWVRYSDGVFSAEYCDAEIEYCGHKLNGSTRDDLLWELGVFRVKPYDFSQHKHMFYKAKRQQQRFTLCPRGKAEATEAFWIHEFSHGDVMDIHLSEINEQKDALFLHGFTYGNHVFDLRFRHISYMSLLGLRANNNSIPDDFEWFDRDGNLVPMNQETVINFVAKMTDYIKDVELRTHKVIKEMSGIEDLVELANYKVQL